MTHSINVLFGFLGGTILAIKDGYKVLPQNRFGQVFERLADAKWFLASHWCEQFSSPAGILTNVGEISYYNEAAVQLGADAFIPPVYRSAIFKLCLPLKPLKTAFYGIPVTDGVFCRSLEIQGIEIDPRFGKVALVKEYILPEIPYMPIKLKPIAFSDPLYSHP